MGPFCGGSFILRFELLVNVKTARVFLASLSGNNLAS
jgi:hypothetical protein